MIEREIIEKHNKIPLVYWENPKRIKEHEETLRSCGTAWFYNWSENPLYVGALKLAEESGCTYVMERENFPELMIQKATHRKIDKTELREMRKANDFEWYSKWGLI